MFWVYISVALPGPSPGILNQLYYFLGFMPSKHGSTADDERNPGLIKTVSNLQNMKTIFCLRALSGKIIVGFWNYFSWMKEQSIIFVLISRQFYCNFIDNFIHLICTYLHWLITIALEAWAYQHTFTRLSMVYRLKMDFPTPT